MNEVFRSELLPGTTLFDGKYVIEKKIGAGGFGITYLARHSTLEKLYAIKEFFLSGYNVRNNTTNRIGLSGIEVKNFEKLRQRFFDEARTMAKLNHDSVVKVLDIFNENGTSYMVMPFIQGTTLQNMVDNNGPIEYELAVNYIVQICDALSYIHSKGILHRDVTPDNVIVKPDQKIVLIDFGSARKFSNDITQRHTTIVKQGYAPMEQYSAKSHRGAYTDLYSLGAVFYYILTGERPMDATERVNSQMKEPIEENPKIPEQINAVIMKAMEMDPKDRYQSADEMTHDIMTGEFPQRNAQKYIDTKPSLPVNNNDESTKKPKGKRQKTHLVPNVPKIPKQETPSSSDVKTESQSESNKEPNRSKLKIAAIVVSALAVLMVIFVLGRQQPSTTVRHEMTTDTVFVSTDALNELMNHHCDEIMDCLANDPNDPVALFAIALKAERDGYEINESMQEYWDNVLKQDGSVEKYLLIDTCISNTNFAFVCASKANESLNNYHFKSINGKKEFVDSLRKFLTETKQIESENFNYEIQ